MDVAGALTRKIGPLPAWAYGFILAGVVWVVYWYRGGSSGAVADVATPTDNAADSFAGVADENGTAANLGGSSAAATNGTDTPQDNQSWLSRGVLYLVGFGYDALTASTALTKYLQGEQRSFAENAMVSQVIARYGVPPEGAPLTPGGASGTVTYPPTPGGTPRNGSALPVRGGGPLAALGVTVSGTGSNGAPLPVRGTRPSSGPILPPRR